MEVGYTFPKSLFASTGINSVRFYLSGQNLFNITSFKLWDPEKGGEGFNYPLQWVYSAGLNVSY